MTLPLIGAAFALFHWGLHLPSGISILASLSGVGWIFLKGRWSRPNKVVIVQDLTTGQATYQPMDRATRNYLASRPEKKDADA